MILVLSYTIVMSSQNSIMVVDSYKIHDYRQVFTSIQDCPRICSTSPRTAMEVHCHHRVFSDIQILSLKLVIDNHCFVFIKAL